MQNAAPTVPPPASAEPQAELLQLRAQVRALTEQNQLLHRSEERYRQVVENLGEGMIVIQGRHVVFGNTQAADILRVPHDSVLGAQFLDWVHPDDRAEVAERVRLRGLRAPVPAHTQFRIIGRDGVARWINTHSVVVTWEGQAATMSFFTDVTEHLATTEALRLSEERYKMVVENVSEGMVVMQGDQLVFANHRASEIARRPRDQLLKLGIYELVHPADRAFVADRHSRRMAGEAMPSRYAFRILPQDGDYTWVEVSVSVVTWNQQPAALIFLSDITQRKALEQQLRHTLEERETVLQNSMVGIAFLSETGRFKWANRAMLGIFGANEFVGMSDSVEPLYLSRAQYLQVGAEVERCIREGRDYQAEQEMRRLDGTRFWAMMSGKSVNPNKSTQGTVWVVMDISKRKELEKALQHTFVEREAILNSTLVGISFNRNRRVEWVNDKYLEMTGHKRADIIGHSSRMFYDSEEEFLAEGRAIDIGLRKHGTYVIERRIARQNGDSFWVVLSGRCVAERDPSGGVIWTMLDITERRRAEEEIRSALKREVELNALRSRFVSMTSHEFRTPLATILSSAELLRYYSDRMDNAEKQETLESIEAAVQRMTRMLERVLLIGKSDADMLEFLPAPLDLDVFCRKLLAEVRASAPLSANPVHYRFALPQAVGLYDEKLLGHIFGNLLSNALKYSPQGQPISFSVGEDDGHVVFELVDQGIGIPADEIPHLFESFHRASNVGNIPGTGLGLSIVKKSVELHGGMIEVESEAGDEAAHGTRFTVRL